MSDGLYLNGTWVSPAEELRLTFQANDLREPATLQTSYSSAFTLPDSLTVRRITEGAESTTSASRVPFSLVPARLIQAGIIVFDGFARLMEYKSDTGWLINLIDKNKALFARLGDPKRKLSTLNLGGWAFRWHTDTVIAAAANAEGYCFPLIDCGAIENGGQAADLLLPAVFVKTLLQTMLREEGYELDWPTVSPYDEFLSALVLPMTTARPKRIVDESFVKDRQARVGIDLTVPNVFPVKAGADFSIRVPFNLIDRPSQGYDQGRLGNYKAGMMGYKADTSMQLAYDLNLAYNFRVRSGGVRLSLQLLKNGTIIKNEDYEQGGPHNVLMMNKQAFRWKGSVDMAVGDEITLQLIGRQFTWIGGWEFLLDTDASSWTLAPDVTVKYGDTYPLADNLPDMTCLDLLKSVALVCSGTYLVDDSARTLRFVPLSPLVVNRREAVDWSDRIDEEEECRYTPSIEPYAQQNALLYRQKDEKETQGNGTLTVVASALAEKATLFTLPFGPVVVSKLSVGGTNAIPRIELRKIDRGFDGTVTVTDKDAENGPHWLLVHPTRTQTMKTLETVGSVNQLIDVPLRVAWFDVRPDVVKQGSGPNLSLSFNDPAAGERGLLTAFFDGLVQILDRPRTLELTRLLTPTELSVLRLDRLVYIEKRSIGGLSLPPTYYYVAQVSDYQPNVPTKITLIAAS